LDQITSFNPSQTEFDSLKSQYYDNYKNHIIKSSEYSKDLRLNLLEDSKWPLLAKRRAFETVTREELVKFAKDLRQNCYVQMHIQGNFYQTEAVEIFNNSLKKLNVVDITPDEGILVLKLPEQPHIIKMKNLNPGDVNSELIWYWQLGEMTIKKYALYDLLITIMEEPCFNFLRTIKTLGYTVFPMLRDTYGIGGLSITVRSQRDKFLVEEVKKCIDEFLLEFKKQLHDMEKDKFEEHRLGLIESKSADDTKLKQLFDRWNAEITSGNYRFDRLETEIEFLDEIEKKDVVKALDDGILKNKRSLVVAVEGSDPNRPFSPDYDLVETNLPPGEAFTGFERICDLDRFKKQQTFFNRAYITSDS